MGQTLTANITPENASATYQWKVSDNADGAFVDIGGSVGNTHTLTENKAGKFIKVEATGNGAYTGTMESAPIEVQAAI